MDLNKFLNMAPMKYWQPDNSDHVERDIIENPEKYSNYIGSYKRDGEWSKVIWDGDHVYILSRSISKKTGEYARKEECLPHLSVTFRALPAGTVLLGEVCYDDLYKRSKDVGSILRCVPQKAIDRQINEEDKLKFYVFDVLSWDGTDLTNTPFIERISYIGKVRSLLGDQYIRYAEYKEVTTIAKEYNDYLRSGGEGFVLQLKDNIYYDGKRPAWKTIKLKKTTDEIELKVVSVLEPTKEYTGKELNNWTYFVDNKPVTKYYYYGWKAGVVVDNNGTKCNISSGINDDDAKWLSTREAEKLIKEGRLIAKVKAMEIEPGTGKMRHGVLLQLRTDI